ncbi:MAG: hypothetical protein N2556_08170, partial [Anaerolineae bacterium]|nr:hypothetical protein [Anaerolineae bacterium]
MSEEPLPSFLSLRVSDGNYSPVGQNYHPMGFCGGDRRAAVAKLTPLSPLSALVNWPERIIISIVTTIASFIFDFGYPFKPGRERPGSDAKPLGLFPPR